MQVSALVLGIGAAAAGHGAAGRALAGAGEVLLTRALIYKLTTRGTPPTQG